MVNKRNLIAGLAKFYCIYVKQVNKLDLESVWKSETKNHSCMCGTCFRISGHIPRCHIDVQLAQTFCVFHSCKGNDLHMFTQHLCYNNVQEMHISAFLLFFFSTLLQYTGHTSDNKHKRSVSFFFSFIYLWINKWTSICTKTLFPNPKA